MRTFIIGDIHGCDKALNRLLIRLRPHEDRDQLILLGDLFDRGPDAWEVFRTVRQLADAYGERFVLILGNHEDFLMREKLSLMERMTWNRVGRLTTVRSFKAHGDDPASAIPWLKAHAQLTYRDERVQCAHAAVRVEPVEANDRQTLVHDHHTLVENSYAGRLTVTGHMALEAPTWFAGDRETAEQIPYGEWRPLPQRGVLCIDTGCGKGGRLTGMQLEEDPDSGALRYRLERAKEE